MWSTRHQSVTSTTRRPSAVRTRRSVPTGSPTATSSAPAISGGAGTMPEVSSAAPGCMPLRPISADTPKLLPRSLGSAGRCVTYVPEPCLRLTKPSSSSTVMAARIEERETVLSRASSGSDGSRSPGLHSPARIRARSSSARLWRSERRVPFTVRRRP
jgi:hypothetical protein